MVCAVRKEGKVPFLEKASKRRKLSQEGVIGKGERKLFARSVKRTDHFRKKVIGVGGGREMARAAFVFRRLSQAKGKRRPW